MSRPKALPDPDWKHLEPGHPDNPKPYRICGGNKGSKDHYQACLQPAGKNTLHFGKGRCYLHGGNLPMGPDHYMSKGRYTSRYIGRLADHFRDIRLDDTNPLDLLPELEAQRVVFSMALDRLNNTGLPLASVVDDREEVEESCSDSDSLDNNGYMVGSGGMVGFGSLGSSVDIPSMEFSTPGDEIPSNITPRPKQSIASRIIREEDVQMCRDLANDIVNTVARIVAMNNQTAITKADITYLLATMKEAMELFVPKENHKAFVKFLMDRVPIENVVEGEMRRDTAVNLAIDAIRRQMKEKAWDAAHPINEYGERCKRSIEKWQEAIVVLLEMREETK